MRGSLNGTRKIGALLLCAVSLFSCGKSEPEAQRFAVRGVVQEVKEGGKVLVIDHEEIPGYMRPMIMPFRVKDASESAGLAAGDELTFTLVVQDLASWIEGIHRTGKKGEIKSQSSSNTQPAAPLLKPGDQLPDYEFVDQDNRQVKLSSFRNGPVALSFIFTRCPVPEYCPATMRKFAEVQEFLSKDPEAPANWHLLTASFDSAHDLPPVMKSFGLAYGQDGKKWSMLSSHACCMQELAANVGLRYGEIKGSYEHNLRTVVLDAQGRIIRIFTDETWKPAELVAGIKAAAKPVASAAPTP